MDGSSKATTEGDFLSKLSSIPKEEILCQTFSEPKTVGLLSGNYSYIYSTINRRKRQKEFYPKNALANCHVKLLMIKLC